MDPLNGPGPALSRRPRQPRGVSRLQRLPAHRQPDATPPSLRLPHPIVERLLRHKAGRAELIWRNRWDTRRQAEGAIFQYINGFYNPRRRHSSLGGKSPLAFERKAA
jgi:hypothetical protein